jgi:hypothetical protein
LCSDELEEIIFPPKGNEVVPVVHRIRIKLHQQNNSSRGRGDSKRAKKEAGIEN